MNLTSDITQCIATGISIGTVRFVGAIPEFAPQTEDIRKAQNLISDYFGEINEEWSLRAVQIFSELIVIGMYSRQHYQEPDLTMDEIRNFAAVLKIIFNSWLHR